MKDSFEAPIPLSLLACDTIITDIQTGKKTLVGLFNSVGAMRYPHMIPQFYVFASLTNGEGDIDIKIRLTAGNGDIVFDLPGKIRVNTPLDSPDMIFSIQNLIIKASGTYELQFLANDIPIASRLITFKEIKPPTPAAEA